MKRRKAELLRVEQGLAFWRGEASRLGWRLRDAEREIVRLREIASSAAPPSADWPAAPEVEPEKTIEAPR